MKYQNYDELIRVVAEFRTEHSNLTDDELDKLVKRTFKIDRATLREIDGVSDLIQSNWDEEKMPVRKCQICDIEFSSNVRNKQVCSSECAKRRKSIQNKKWHAANREKINARMKDYYEENKEKILSRQKERMTLSEEARLAKKERAKRYHKKSIELRLQSGEKIRRYNKSRQSDEADRSQINKRRRERYQEDDLFALTARVRALVNKGVRDMNLQKSESTEKYLGCDFATFKNHIESNFKKGISWENRDKWHIDHIVPISTAKTEQEFILLSNYKNLQPMWAEENIAKSNKLGFHGVTSSISTKYAERGQLQQYRYGNSVEFVCDKCSKKKKSKLIVVIDDDWERIMCNGCYGNTLSKTKTK